MSQESEENLLRWRTLLNRHLYQQKTISAAEELAEQQQPTIYQGYSNGLGRVENLTGSASYGSAITNGAIALGDNVRMRGNKYDSVPRVNKTQLVTTSVEQYFIETVFNSLDSYKTILLGGYIKTKSKYTLSNSGAFTSTGYVTNLGRGQYSISTRFKSGNNRIFISLLPFKENSLSITDNSDEYYLGNGLWESLSQTPSRNTIHGGVVKSNSVSNIGTNNVDQWGQSASKTNITAYADTWTPGNESERFNYTRTLTYLDHDGEYIPESDSTNGIIVTVGSGSNGDLGIAYYLLRDVESFSFLEPYVSYMDNADRYLTAAYKQDTASLEIVNITRDATTITVDINFTDTYSRHYFAKFTDPFSLELHWEEVGSPDTWSSTFTIRLVAQPYGAGSAGTMTYISGTDNYPYRFIDSDYSTAVNTAFYPFTWDSRDINSLGSPVPLAYTTFLDRYAVTSPNKTATVDINGSVDVFYNDTINKITTYARNVHLDAQFIPLTTPAVIPSIKTEKYLSHYIGKYLIQKTATGYIYQDYEYTVQQTVNRLSMSPVDTTNENKNSLTYDQPDSSIILNTDDFLVIKIINTISSLNLTSTSFTITARYDTSGFTINPAIVGQSILFNYNINTVPCLISGTITDLSYASNILTIICSIRNIKQNTKTSFFGNLLTNNGSFYSYYFRNLVLNTYPFITKNILGSIVLNPLVNLFLSFPYSSSLLNTISNNLKTDNIAGNKIYSVVSVPTTNGQAIVDEWIITTDGLVKYNKTFKTNYIKLSTYNNYFISHSYNV